MEVLPDAIPAHPIFCAAHPSKTYFSASEPLAEHYILVDGENVSRQKSLEPIRESQDAQVVWFSKSKMAHQHVDALLQQLGLRDRWIGSIRVEMDCDTKLMDQDSAGAVLTTREGISSKGHRTVECQYDSIYHHDHCSFDDMAMLWFAAGFEKGVQVNVVSSDHGLKQCQEDCSSEDIFRTLRTSCSKRPSHRSTFTCRAKMS